MNYLEISKKTISAIYQSYNNLKDSPLDPQIRALVELKVSQINGCSYCSQLHKKEALNLGITEQKLIALPNHKTSIEFNDKEKLALSWAESVTLLGTQFQDIKDELANHYSEREIVDLTACIAIMNTLNRIAITLK